MYFSYMRRLLLTVVFGCLVAAYQPVSAVELTGLFKARTPVTSQDASERKVAVELALMDVLTRVTGDSSIVNQPVIAEAIVSASQLVSLFQYKESDPDEVTITPWVLEVTFDEQGVRNLLIENGFPFWPAQRPELILWIGVERASNRALLGESNEELSELRQALQVSSKKRGVPVILPLLDEEDMGNISYADIWGGFRQEIMTASARYNTRHILVGTLSSAAGDRIRGKWRLWTDYDEIEWSSEQSDLKAVADEAIAQAAQTMARYYALRPGNDALNRFGIYVKGLETASQYALIQNTLSQFSGVEKVEVVGLEQNRCLLVVSVRGQSDLFFSAINNSDLLRVSVPPDIQEDVLIQTVGDLPVTYYYDLTIR